MFRILSAALLVPFALAETPACAVTGEGYSDLVNGDQHTTTEDAMKCQENCKRTDICAFFTWYPDTKGCWLQSSTALKNISVTGVVSGPVRCPGEATVPTVDSVVDGVKTGKVGKVVEALNSSTGASFPWWGWVLIGLAVASIGLCVLSFICCSTRKKSKRSQKVAKKDIEEGVQPESAPLMTGAPAMQAAAAPISSVRSCAAAPVTSMSGASPVYTQQMQAAAPVGSMMYAPAPVNYVQAAPMASGGQDLFSQLDSNGDGVLTPAELAAMQGMRPMPAVPAGFTQVPQ